MTAMLNTINSQLDYLTVKLQRRFQSWRNQRTSEPTEYADHKILGRFPRRRSPITESTREVLFLFDWCFCAWLPPSLYLRDPRASLGDCEDRSRSRPLRRKWSGASLRGALPLRGPHPQTEQHCKGPMTVHAPHP